MSILDKVIDILGLLLFFIGVYYLAIAFFSLIPPKNKRTSVKRNRYAVIIPAHNEGAVIGNLLKSISCAEYPKEYISVFVIADGCSDCTAEIAQAFGAEVIFKESSTNKGDALKYAFSSEKFLNKEFDCVAVFDADNIVMPYFFEEIDIKIASRAMAVQGYIDSKNAFSSWVSNAHSIWYWISNRASLLGRAKLGLGARLCGTGMVLKAELLKLIPWETETLAEDLEYTCILAENNIKVDYSERAVVLDEKPEKLSASVTQRSRWARGVSDVQGKYTFRFLIRGKFNDLLGMWSDVLSPFIFFFFVLIVVFDIGSIWQALPGEIVLHFFIAAYILITLVGLMADRKLTLKAFMNVFGFLLYMLSWILSGFFGIFCEKPNVWKHTPHNDKTN